MASRFKNDGAIANDGAGRILDEMIENLFISQYMLCFWQLMCLGVIGRTLNCDYTVCFMPFGGHRNTFLKLSIVTIQ